MTNFRIHRSQDLRVVPTGRVSGVPMGQQVAFVKSKKQSLN